MAHLRTPVYQISPRSLAIVFGGLGLVVLPAMFADQLLRAKKPSRGATVNPFDRPAIGQDSQLAEWLSNLGTILGVGAPFVVDWFDTRGEREAFRDDAVVIGQALALNGALNTLIKYIVQRPLPSAVPALHAQRGGLRRAWSELTGVRRWRAATRRML